MNSSEMTTVPEGYKLRVVGDYYYNGGDELRVEVIKEKTQGGRVNVVYYCEEDNTVWAPGEIWAKGLVNGKGNVNSSEMTTVPKGYHLKVVGDYYYDGGSELRVRIVKDDTKTGGWVNVVYYCKGRQYGMGARTDLGRRPCGRQGHHQLYRDDDGSGGLPLKGCGRLLLRWNR